MGEFFESDFEENVNIDDLQDAEEEASEEQPSAESFSQMLYKVRLDYSSECFYATPDDNEKFSKGDMVVLPTKYGRDLGRVLGIAKSPVRTSIDSVIRIIRRATHEEIEHAAELQKNEPEAARIFMEKVRLHAIDMKLVAVHFLAFEQKVLFFFNSEGRVDFRDLVKALVSVFKMRIELRQIGSRDESRVIGGLGSCGRVFCCHSVSDKLQSVSIKMAKEQSVSLSSSKISGACGRLLCCLAFEHENYAELRRSLPSEGTRLRYNNVIFRVTELNTMSMMIKLQGEDGSVLVVPASSVSLKGTHWTIAPQDAKRN